MAFVFSFFSDSDLEIRVFGVRKRMNGEKEINNGEKVRLEPTILAVLVAVLRLLLVLQVEQLFLQVDTAPLYLLRFGCTTPFLQANPS